MATAGPSDASCEIRTFREGVLSPVGHDLVLRVRSFRVDAAPGRIEGRFDAGALEVAGPDALSGGDRRKIEARVRDEVLDVRRHPEVVFVSTRIEGPRVDGDLTIRGVTRSISFVARETGARLVARVELPLSSFGVAPVTAFFGALRVRDAVEVEIAVPGGLASAIHAGREG